MIQIKSDIKRRTTLSKISSEFSQTTFVAFFVSILHSFFPFVFKLQIFNPKGCCCYILIAMMYERTNSIQNDRMQMQIFVIGMVTGMKDIMYQNQIVKGLAYANS